MTKKEALFQRYKDTTGLEPMINGLYTTQFTNALIKTLEKAESDLCYCKLEAKNNQAEIINKLEGLVE